MIVNIFGLDLDTLVVLVLQSKRKTLFWSTSFSSIMLGSIYYYVIYITINVI